MCVFVSVFVCVHVCVCPINIKMNIMVWNIEPDLGMEPGLAHHFFLQLINGIVSALLKDVSEHMVLDCAGILTFQRCGPQGH